MSKGKIYIFSSDKEIRLRKKVTRVEDTATRKKEKKELERPVILYESAVTRQKIEQKKIPFIIHKAKTTQKLT